MEISKEKNTKKLYETENLEKVNVLLISAYSDTQSIDEVNRSLEELKQLVETSLGDCVDSDFYFITQNRPNPDIATYLGLGKAQEAGQLCVDNNISMVVADSEMSPSQIRNLENEINENNIKNEKIRVIDRTMLILDIFAKHAVTGEGKLQVEIAQLKYTSPRLAGRGIDMSRQAGTSGSIGTRGPGETKLETDKRHIQRRILALQEALVDMENDRATKRSRRIKNGIPLVAIAGYTNAGKSTLLNYLTDAGVLVQNKLFATLDPTVRNLKLPSGKEVLLSDTVGFISRLPHRLVEAFKSTLDEVRFADVILVVVDCSDGEAKLKRLVTEQTLSQIGASEKKIIYVYNKCDMFDLVPSCECNNDENVVCVSAKTGLGTSLLLETIDKVLAESKTKVKFSFPFDKQSAVANLYKNAIVISEEYTQNGVEIEALVDEKLFGMYKEYIME